MTATATRAAVSTDSVAFMDAMMRDRVTPRHPQMRVSPKLRAVALALGCSEATAEKRMYGEHAVNLQTAKIIECLLLRGETEEAGAFEAPILAALMGTTVPHWSEAVHEHNRNDGLEDVRQASWIHDQSDENLDAYIRQLAPDIRAAERLLAALVQERNARRAK
jgi:hypothetical protein